MRPDQKQLLERLAGTLNISVSDLLRWIIDNGATAIDSAWKELNDG